MMTVGTSGDEEQLSVFVDTVFDGFGRADQRRAARDYLRGLLDPQGQRGDRPARSVEQVASRALQQFITFSPWGWEGPRRRIAGLTRQSGPVEALAVVVSAIPKRGPHSVGVGRRFISASGRTVNCQLAVGAFLASETVRMPVDWELVLDDEWVGDGERRNRARIPESIRPQPLWQHLLDLVERSAAGDPQLPVVADLSAFCEAWPAARALASAGRPFVLTVRPEQRIPALPGTPTAEDALRAAGVSPHRGAVFRRGLRPEPFTAFITNLRAGLWLVGEWSTGVHQFTRYWLTNCGDDKVSQIVALGRHAERTEATIDELKARFGVLDFHGRSFPGWHRHMTMVSAAYAYCRLDHDTGHCREQCLEAG